MNDEQILWNSAVRHCRQGYLLHPLMQIKKNTCWTGTKLTFKQPY